MTTPDIAQARRLADSIDQQLASNESSHVSPLLRALAEEVERMQALFAGRPIVNIEPPATSRDRWMYEQGRLAERDLACAAIKAEDDHCALGDYMLDSDDCIKVIRGTWVRPDWTLTPAA